MLIIWVLTLIMHADRTTTVTHYYQFESQKDCEAAKASQDAEMKKREILSESFCSPREEK